MQFRNTRRRIIKLRANRLTLQVHLSECIIVIMKFKRHELEIHAQIGHAQLSAVHACSNC